MIDKAQNISAVIIAKNEEKHIADCIKALLKLTDDIVVVDSESTDETVNLANNLGARVFVKAWEGYGANKNFGAEKALHPWILSVDADEILDEELIQSICALNLNEKLVYQCKIVMNYCGHWLKYTEWKPIDKPRLYNRLISTWDLRIVHEGLIHKESISLKSLKGRILHNSYLNYQEHLDKNKHYAQLSAQQWIANSYEPSMLKKIFGPSFYFIKSYFFQLGFLEGNIGLRIAKTNAKLYRDKIKHFYYLRKLTP